MNANHERQTNDEVDSVALLETFHLTQVDRRSLANGQWVKGTIGGHRFDALVFPEHAECESYELAKSRISKLAVIDATRRVVASFDRGWDIRPTTQVAEAIVDALSEGLAETVFGR